MKSKSEPEASRRDTGAVEPFNYWRWHWDLHKPEDLFSPASGLTPMQERVATKMHAHANKDTGFTFVTAERIAALMERDRGQDQARRGGSPSHVTAARAVLRRRGFIRAGYGKDPRGNDRKGYYLQMSSHWRHASGAKYERLAGPTAKTPNDGVFCEGENSEFGSEKLRHPEFRERADLIEGTNQELLPFASASLAIDDASSHGANEPSSSVDLRSEDQEDEFDDAVILRDIQSGEMSQAQLNYWHMTSIGCDRARARELVDLPEREEGRIARAIEIVEDMRDRAAIRGSIEGLLYTLITRERLYPASPGGEF